VKFNLLSRMLSLRSGEAGLLCGQRRALFFKKTDLFRMW
jgi:hypothetical protein